MICKYLFYQSDGTRKRNKKIRRVQKPLVSRQIALNTRHLHFLEIIVFPDHLLSYVTVTHLPNISTPNTLILIYVIASFCLFQIISLSIHLSMSIKSMTMNLNHCGDHHQTIIFPYVCFRCYSSWTNILAKFTLQGN